MTDQGYTILVSWENRGSKRFCVGKAFDKAGELIASFPTSVNDSGVDLPDFYRRMGHLPDIEVEQLVRSELKKKVEEKKKE